MCTSTDPDADRVGTVKDQEGKFIINGNQTATVLTYYILKQLKEQGKLKGNEYTIKTIVTSELVRKERVLVLVKNDVFTGFKFIAERILSLEGKRKIYMRRRRKLWILNRRFCKIRMQYQDVV